MSGLPFFPKTTYYRGTYTSQARAFMHLCSWSPSSLAPRVAPRHCFSRSAQDKAGAAGAVLSEGKRCDPGL